MLTVAIPKIDILSHSGMPGAMNDQCTSNNVSLAAFCEKLSRTKLVGSSTSLKFVWETLKLLVTSNNRVHSDQQWMFNRAHWELSSGVYRYLDFGNGYSACSFGWKFDSLESVCAVTPDRYSSIETKLDTNVCLSSAIIWSHWMTLLWCCGGAAPVGSKLH